MVQGRRLSAWSNMELQQVQCDSNASMCSYPCTALWSSGLVGLTCCWGVIIKSGCPAQEREKLTNPTPHNSASKRIRVRHWAQPMTRFKSFTLAHPSSAISIISIIIIIITTALYPGINKNKGLLRLGKHTIYWSIEWLCFFLSRSLVYFCLGGIERFLHPWWRQEHRR